MWIYEKKLQFPVKIKTPDPAAAKIIVSQLGGPDGELAASMRYLNQRFSMPYREVAGILTDVGTKASERYPRRLTAEEIPSCRFPEFLPCAVY